MYDRLKALQGEALAALEAAADADAMEAWRVQYLGRKGALVRGHESPRCHGTRGATRLRAGSQ